MAVSQKRLLQRPYICVDRGIVSNFSANLGMLAWTQTTQRSLFSAFWYHSAIMSDAPDFSRVVEAPVVDEEKMMAIAPLIWRDPIVWPPPPRTISAGTTPSPNAAAASPHALQMQHAKTIFSQPAASLYAPQMQQAPLRMPELLRQQQLQALEMTRQAQQQSRTAQLQVYHHRQMQISQAADLLVAEHQGQQGLKSENDELRRSEQVLTVILDLVVAFDSSGCITLVSDSFARFFDCTKEELEGTSFWNLLTKPSAQLIKGMFVDALKISTDGKSVPLGNGESLAITMFTMYTAVHVASLRGTVHHMGESPECVCSIRPEGTN